MMYKCKTCRVTVPDGERHVYCVRREDGSTVREVEVCALCYRVLTEKPSVQRAPAGDERFT